MDMLRVHSLQDCNALPKTKWNIRQPEGEALSLFASFHYLESLECAC